MRRCVRNAYGIDLSLCSSSAFCLASLQSLPACLPPLFTTPPLLPLVEEITQPSTLSTTYVYKFLAIRKIIVYSRWGGNLLCTRSHILSLLIRIDKIPAADFWGEMLLSNIFNDFDADGVFLLCVLSARHVSSVTAVYNWTRGHVWEVCWSH